MATSNYEILISARDNASAGINNVGNALNKLDQTAQKTGKSLEQTGQKSANMGQSIARGLMVAQSMLDILAPSLGKLAPEFDNAIRSAQQLAGALSLGASFGPIGIAIGVITAAFGVMIAKMAEADAAAKKFADDIQESLTRNEQAMSKYVTGLMTSIDPLKTLASEAGTTSEALKRMFDEGGYDAALLANNFINISSNLKTAQNELDNLIRKRDNLINEANAKKTNLLMPFDPQTQEQIDAFNAKIAFQKVLVGDLQGAWAALRGEIQQVSAPRAWTLSDQEYADREKARSAADRYAEGLKKLREQFYGIYEDPVDQAIHDQGEAMSSAELAAEKYAAAMKQLKDTLRQMVDKALTPTEVTDADMEATKAGTYIDKWDEFRRRAEDVLKNGVDPSKYGAAFVSALQKMQQGTGLALDQLIAKYKDFSLFADKNIMNLAISTGAVNLDTIVADVSNQIDQIIGKANLIGAAFDRVWASLSTQKKLDLAKALGIEGITDANVEQSASKIEKAITDPMGGASSSVNALKTAITGVPTAHSTTFNILKAKDFDTTLQQILDDINKIPSAADVVVTMTYENRGGNLVMNPAGEMVAQPAGGGRAAGGLVYPWMSYLVGETGAEIFRPKVPGEIFSNADTMKMLKPDGKATGDWGTQNFYFSVNAVNFEQFMRQVRAYARHAM